MSCKAQAENKNKSQEKEEKASQTQKNHVDLSWELNQSQKTAVRTYSNTKSSHVDQRKTGLNEQWREWHQVIISYTYLSFLL